MLLLMLLAVAVRSPGIGRPLVGNFATKNVVYAMIARNWASGQAGVWTPTLDVLRGGRPALHLVEVPVSAYASGLLWRCFGGSLDFWGRATSVAMIALSVGLIYRLASVWHSRRVATAASVALALSPVSIIYGQSFMLEPSVVCLSLGAMLAVVRWKQSDRTVPLLVTVGLMSILFLTKIYMLVLIAPLAALAATRSPDESLSGCRKPNEPARIIDPQAKRTARLVVFVTVAALAALPALLWCFFVMRDSAPGSATAASIFYSLRGSVGANELPHPLLASRGFYSAVARDLATVTLTPLGAVLALVGLAHSAWRRHFVWLAVSAMLIVLLPRKFHEMNYYFLVILPPLALLVGLGWEVVCRRLALRRLGTAAVVSLAMAISLRYAWHPVLRTLPQDRSVVAAAAELRRRAGAGEPVVTMHGSTLDLLYYCDRRGWALAPEQSDLLGKLTRCRRQGARWLVVAGLARSDGSPTCRAALTSFSTAVEGDDFRIYDMSPAPSRRRVSKVATPSSENSSPR